MLYCVLKQFMTSDIELKCYKKKKPGVKSIPKNNSLIGWNSALVS